MNTNTTTTTERYVVAIFERNELVRAWSEPTLEWALDEAFRACFFEDEWFDYNEYETTVCHVYIARKEGNRSALVVTERDYDAIWG